MKWLVSLIIGLNLSAETYIFIDSVKSEQPPIRSGIVIKTNDRLFDISTSQPVLVGQDFYKLIAVVDEKLPDNLSYIFYLETTEGRIWSNLNSGSTTNFIWDQEKLSELENQLTQKKQELLSLQLDILKTQRQTRLLKADAAAIGDLNKIAAMRVRLKDLTVQLEKMTIDKELLQTLLQQTGSIGRPQNFDNRLLELEKGLQLVRDKANQLAATSSGLSKEDLERKLKTISDTAGEDVTSLEAELESLRMERKRMELDNY